MRPAGMSGDGTSENARTAGMELRARTDRLRRDGGIYPREREGGKRRAGAAGPPLV
jgi:hypothetical protein